MKPMEENLKDLFMKYTTDGRIPGISAQVVQRGETLAHVVTGLADKEAGKVLKEDALFRIYSMSKVITILGAMQLFEKGLFTLETPLSDFIPSFRRMNVITGYDQDIPLLKPAVQPILMKHLLTMTSGIPYGFNPGSLPADRFLLNRIGEAEKEKSAPQGSLNTRDYIEALAGTALAFEPGDDFLYGYNHDILGRVIEVLSGESFGSYLKKNIFDPLEMKETTFLPDKEQAERLVPLYRTVKAGEAPVRVAQDDPLTSFLFKKGGFESGGGGLISSLGDYSRYCEALLKEGSFDGHRIIGRKTLNLINRNHLTGKALATMSGDGYGYGLGVRVMMNPSLAGIPGSRGEYGWSGAAATWMCIDPAEELYAVMMLQLADCPYPLQREFAQILYGALA
ncbi:serine hydrolase [Oceanispirochaeta sp.]|uniref:serine hydrolase domain-containing protein n=1 Tax=Oceanispirochaeta sp. TaxID=2035350 RepID=UPI00261B4A4D|nr:serine hydrolase domain-containing protein [Oceanispirochaeta sp.]MDA3956568.1 serine hydrolase [Oceanispirochaeta sp.]